MIENMFILLNEKVKRLQYVVLEDSKDNFLANPISLSSTEVLIIDSFSMNDDKKSFFAEFVSLLEIAYDKQ